MNQEAEALKNQGNEFVKQKKYQEAVDTYSKAINLLSNVSSPAEVDQKAAILNNRAAAQLSSGEYQKAYDDAQSALVLKPNWSRAQVRVGQALLQQNKLDEAVEFLEKAMEVNSSDAQLKSLLDEVTQKVMGGAKGANPLGGLFGPDMFSKIASNPKLMGYMAQPDFQRMVQDIQQNPNNMNKYLQDPRFMELFSALLGVNVMTGDQFSKQQQPPQQESPKPSPTPSYTAPSSSTTSSSKPAEPKEEKMEDDETGLTAEQKQAEEAKARGNEFYKKKQFNEALVEYEKAAKLWPENIIFKLNKAAVYLESGDIDRCITECDEAIESGRKAYADFKLIAKAYARKGNAYMKKQMFKEAIAAYKESLTEHRTREVSLSLQEAEKKLRQKEESEYLDPQKAKEAKELGNESFKNQKYPEAIAHFREAIKRNPNDETVYGNRAAAYMKLGEYPSAVKDCEKAIELNEKYIKAYVRKAQCHFFMKEYHKAISCYDEALKHEPNNQELKEGRMKVEYTMNSTMSDEERRARAMQDPEIRAIMQDPVIAQVLKEMQESPQTAAKHLSNQDIARKIEKLIAAGILQTK